MEVAYKIAEYLPKTDNIVGSILHDIIEDTKVSKIMIKDEFGPRIAKIVDRLTGIDITLLNAVLNID